MKEYLNQPGKLESSFTALDPGVHCEEAIVAKHLAGKLLKLAQAVVVEGSAAECVMDWISYFGHLVSVRRSACLCRAERMAGWQCPWFTAE